MKKKTDFDTNDLFACKFLKSLSISYKIATNFFIYTTCFLRYIIQLILQYKHDINIIYIHIL